MVLLKLIEDWRVCFDRREVVVVVVIDLSKVFDFVCYLFFLVKLKVYGFMYDVLEIMIVYFIG